MHVEVTVFTKCFLLAVRFSSFLPLMFSLPQQPQQVPGGCLEDQVLLFSTVATLGTQMHFSVNAEGKKIKPVKNDPVYLQVKHWACLIGIRQFSEKQSPAFSH